MALEMSAMNYTRICGFAVLFLAAFFCAPAALAADAIEFESPQGGEVFYAGQTQILRLKSRYKSLVIELSRDGGATYELLGSANKKVAARVTFEFAVGGTSTYNAILRATGNAAHGTFVARSAPFAIVGADAPVEPKKAAGNYIRANVSVDENGEIIGVASSGPVNLASEVTGALGNANLAAEAVTNDKIAPATITADRINSNPASDGFVLAADGLGHASWLPIRVDGGAPGGTAGGDLSGLYPNPNIAVNAVTTTKIKDGAVDLATKTTGTLADSHLSANVALLGGRAGGQTLYGGTAPSENFSLVSTQSTSRGNILLAPTGGNVGIGTPTPGQRLSVAGTVESTSGGFRFPDGTTQSTAAGAGVPSGFSILGDSTTPPAGFSYTGNAIVQGSEQWTSRAAMPVGAATVGVGVINGLVYLVGGTNGPMLNDCQEYNPTSNTWRARAAMPTARDWLACAVYNNRLYTFGGYNGSTMLNVTEMYDPATNSWTALAPVPTARSGAVAATVNGKIYVIGGDLAGTTELTTNEEYDPSTNTWASRAGMPTARTAGGVAVANNRIFYIGGSTADNNTLYNRNEAYDPSSNTWTTLAPLSFARHNHAVTAFNGRIYVMGGTASGAPLSNNDEYDPATNSWASKAGMPGTRQYINAGVVNNGVYVFGGYDGSYTNTTTEYSISGVTYFVHRKN